MSYLPLPVKSEITGPAHQMLEDAEKRWGYTPNICRAYALVPDIMEAEDVWAKGVMHQGALSRKLKEGIATIVSTTNDCNYCASSHAHAFTLAGGDKEEAISCKNLELSSFDERERASFEFSHKAATDAKSITQEDINTLLQYYTPAEIVEIAAVIQQFMGYNWFVTILGLQLEEKNPMTHE